MWFGWLAVWFDGVYCGCAMALRCVCVFIFHIFGVRAGVCVCDVFFPLCFHVSLDGCFSVLHAHTTQQTHTVDPIYRVCCVCYCCLFYVLSFTLSASAGLAKVEHYDTTIQVESTPVGITKAHLKCTIQSHHSIYAMLYQVNASRNGEFSRKF